MSFYPLTIMTLRTRISSKFGCDSRYIKPDPFKTVPPEHLLWMAEQMGEWENSEENRIRAAEWISEIIHYAEKLELWSKEEVRELIHRDEKEMTHHEKVRGNKRNSR